MKPDNATHHELGPNGVVYYDCSVKPHKKWLGADWIELGQYADATQWATPVDQPPVMKKSSKANFYRIYTGSNKFSNE